VDAATVRRLTEAEGQLLLKLLQGGNGADGIAVGERLRREHDPALVAAAMTVHELRDKAVAKLGPADAAVLVTDRTGLEQATRRVVAERRAARLAAVGRTAADLTCGIGVDLVALLRAGMAVTGVDRDPARVAMARANLAALGLAATVVEAAAESVDLDDFDAAFVDPSRRDGHARRFDPAAYSPAWPWVETLLVRPTPVSVAKVAPGFPHDLVPPGVEAEFTSVGGDLVEAALWSSPLATARRRATVLPAGAELTDADEPDFVPLGPIAEWLYEPDDAVIRAGLVTAVAASVGGHLIDPQIAYVSSEDRVSTPFARAYRVLEEVPYRERALRQALHERGIGRLTIKKRGVDVAPDRLRPRLRLHGDGEATLVLSRVSGAARAFLVEPVSSPGG